MGLDPGFGGKPFSFVHYLAVISALRVNADFSARLYYHYEPSGPYWDAVQKHIELVKVPIPTEIYGNPVRHYAHKADIIRLQMLLTHGGIYLDMDCRFR